MPFSVLIPMLTVTVPADCVQGPRHSPRQAYVPFLSQLPRQACYIILHAVILTINASQVSGSGKTELYTPTGRRTSNLLTAIFPD